MEWRQYGKREHVHTTNITSSSSIFGGVGRGHMPPRYTNDFIYRVCIPPYIIPLALSLFWFSSQSQLRRLVHMRPSRSKKLLITTMRYVLPTLQLRLRRRSFQLLLWEAPKLSQTRYFPRSSKQLLPIISETLFHILSIFWIRLNLLWYFKRRAHNYILWVLMLIPSSDIDIIHTSN